MQDRSNFLKQNPLYDILLITKHLGVEQHNGLERVYHIGKSNKVLGKFRDRPGMNNDLAKIDHNKVLDLYPEYEYIYGPYIDSSKEEFNSVYLLFTNRINQDNHVRVLYANRVLMEHNEGKQLDYNEKMRDETGYRNSMDALRPLPGKLSNHCYYKDHRWTVAEIAEIKRLYGAMSVTHPRYNPIRENFVCGVMIGSGNHLSINVYRLLCEIYYVKRRMTSDEVVTPVNGKKGDLRPENVFMRDLEQEDIKMRQEAFEVHGLDTHALEKIYVQTGFNRFRGVYKYKEDGGQNGLRGRKYVKLVRDGSDEQHTILLSRALMTVKEGRVLSFDETVDHIDHDSHNDVISNLRMITRTAHISQDSVRVEYEPFVCGVCNKQFMPDNKAFSYYKLNPYIPTCSPKCKAHVRTMSVQDKETKLAEKKIVYRYYVLDKDYQDGVKSRLYFPEGMEYDACVELLFNKGEDAFVKT